MAYIRIAAFDLGTCASGPRYSGGTIGAAELRDIQQYYLLANARFIKGIQSHKLSRSARPVWPAGYAILAAAYRKKKDMLVAGRDYYARLYSAFHDMCRSDAAPNYLNVLPRDLRNMIADFLTVVTNTDTKCIAMQLGVPHEISFRGTVMPYQIKLRVSILRAKWMSGTTICMYDGHVEVARVVAGNIMCSCNRHESDRIENTIIALCRPCACGKFNTKVQVKRRSNDQQCCNSCGRDTIDYDEYRTRMIAAATYMAEISYDFRHVYMANRLELISKPAKVFKAADY